MKTYSGYDNNLTNAGKEGTSTMAKTFRILVALALASVGAGGWSDIADAATCFTCHAPLLTATDIRPVDAAYRNITTGGFKGSHSKHIQASTILPNACTGCHGAAVSSYTTDHRNGKIEITSVVGYSKGTSVDQSGNPTLGTCSTASCHDNGKGVLVATPTWGTSTPTCTACHALVPGDSHTKHITGTSYKKAVCADCHTGYVQGTTAAANHLNSTIEVNTGGYPSPKVKGSPFASCATSYCHSSGQSANGASATPVYAATAPTWGGTAVCGSCHATTGLATGSHSQHIGQTLDCAFCHTGATASAYDSTSHVDGQINVASGLSYANQGTPGNGYSSCNSSTCHGSGIVPWGGTLWSTTDQCGKCHSSNAAGAVTAGVPFYSTSYPVKVTANTDSKAGAHTDHLAGTKNLSTAIACSECHAVPATVTAAGHMSGTAVVAFNGSLAKANTTTATTCATTWCHGGNTTLIPQNSPARTAPVWGTRFPATSTLGTGGPAGTSGSGYCAQCHGYPPLTASHTGKTAPTCISCHPHLNSDALTFNDKTKHINGSIQASGDCITCHSGAQGVRRIVTGASGDFVKTSHHVTNGTTTEVVTINACTVCHGDLLTDRSHPNGTPVSPNVDLRDPDTGAYVATTPAGVEQVCAGCHDANGATRTGLPTGSTATQPFKTVATDTGSPVNIGWTAAGMAHSYRTTPAVGGGCLGCHNNSHGNANAKMLSYTYNAASEQTFCYNCHGTVTAGGSQTAIQPLFSKTRKHSTESCNNCHNQHQAKPGTHTVGASTAGGVLNGTSGASLTTNPAFWTAPTAGSFTAKTIVSGTDLEATLCFKCHTAYTAAYNAVSPSGAFAMTDIAKEFNPNNVGNFATTGTTSWQTNETAGGFHPVLATAGSNLGAIKLANLVTTNIAWSTTARNRMTCSDCHGSDTTTDPLGPHGSAANFVLRGPNTTWSSSVVLAATIPAGTFCLNCHANSFTNSRFPDHSRSNHRVACYNCHAAVPHGGPRPGMLVAPAGAAAAVGGTIAGWDATAPYYGLTGTQTKKLYILSYPASNTASWAQSNCACNVSNSH